MGNCRRCHARQRPRNLVVGNKNSKRVFDAGCDGYDYDSDSLIKLQQKQQPFDVVSTAQMSEQKNDEDSGEQSRRNDGSYCIDFHGGRF